MKLKNPGPALRSVFRGALDLIPREFRAKLGIRQVVQQQPTDVDADVPDGVSLVESRVEQERTDERKKTDTFLDGALTETLVAQVKLPDGQVATSTRSLVAEGTPLVIDSRTADADQKNLGNGLLDQTVVEAPLVLGLPKYEKEIPDTLPDRFKVAVPTTTTDLTVEGVAMVPVLGVGDLDKSEEQIDVFKKRTHVKTRATVLVPQTLIGKDTNNEKQILTITETYKTAGGDAVPTALKDVKVENLGDGRVLQTESAKPSVLPLSQFTASIEDNIPPEFKALVEKKITASTTIGTAADFDLAPGQFRKDVRQLNAFDIRTEIETRSTVPGQTFEDKYFGGPSYDGSEFSGIATKTKVYDPDTILDPDVSFFAFDSKVTNIGAGASVKETDSLPAYPVLVDTVADAQGLKVTRTKTVVPRGTPFPSVYGETKAIDSERSLQIVETGSFATIDTYQVFSGKVDIDLPSQLLSVFGNVSAVAANGTYSEGGFYSLAGNGSGGISVNGTARGAAAIIPDITYDVKQPWGQNVPCTHYIIPVARDDVNITLPNGFERSLWNFFFGPTGTIVALRRASSLLAWPIFAPKSVVFTLKGAKVTSESQGNIRAADVLTVDYLGATKHSAQTRTSGIGLSQEVEVTVKTVRLPPTIHNALTVNHDILTQAYNNSGTMNVGTGNIVSMGAFGQVTGEIDPLTVPATLGQTTIPTSGLYLYKFFAEYYKYNFMLCHYVVVDFAFIF